jgi:hypothetical protein
MSERAPAFLIRFSEPQLLEDLLLPPSGPILAYLLMDRLYTRALPCR